MSLPSAVRVCSASLAHIRVSSASITDFREGTVVYPLLINVWLDGWKLILGMSWIRLVLAHVFSVYLLV